MREVDRPRPNEDISVAFYPKYPPRLADAVSELPESPSVDQLDWILSNAIHVLTYGSVAQPASRELLLAAERGGAAGGALFGIASGEVTVTLDEATVTLLHQGTKGCQNYVRWLEAFQLACIARDAEALDLLAATPMAILRRSGATCDPFLDLFTESMQLLWRRLSGYDPADGLGRQLQLARTSAHPTNLKVSPPQVALRYATQVDVIEALLAKDGAGFNDALVEALEAHQASWSDHAPTAWIALGPLAVTCLAVDRGLPLEVTSPYLPPALISRSFAD